jgi:hypothetical protein
MISKEMYFSERNKLYKNRSEIGKIEEKYSQILLNDVLLPTAENIRLDFSTRPFELLPFWINYPPEQRGRAFSGKSIPWLELGEKTIGSNLIKELSLRFRDIIFPGLPTGGDIRFLTGNVFIHLDIKLTGPTDNPNEVVVPPNQVSGDGKHWKKGVINSTFPLNRVRGGLLNYNFQPKLPPFYILDGKSFLCLTFFLDAIYGVESFGNHPLEYFELSCVPNGLIMFDGPRYCDTPGLFIAGKDDNTKAESTKRIRVRLKPLSTINGWRSVKIMKENNIWTSKQRQ